jgi:hypothetical protein
VEVLIEIWLKIFNYYILMGVEHMYGPYIAVKTFEHQIECFCPDGDHAVTLSINSGEIFEVTNKRTFRTANAWYYLVRFNDQCMFYMSLDDLEQYFMKEQLLSMLDIDLEINYLQFQINKALDTGDEAFFLNNSKKLKEVHVLKERLEEYLRKVAV